MTYLCQVERGAQEMMAHRFPPKREFFIDNLLVRIHSIIEMILADRHLAPWEFGFPFPGSLVSTFLGLPS